MHSNTTVKNAGKLIRDADGLPHDDSLAVLDYWRSSHETSTKVAYCLLNKYSKDIDPGAYSSWRLKRLESIIYKLKRFEKMSLPTMDDIGGCRAVVRNSKLLDLLYVHLLRNEEFKDCKDYRKGKPDGYRGIHLIKRFETFDSNSRNVELQIRTKMQHCWATTVEVVDLLTGQNLKGGYGDSDWKQFFFDIAIIFDLVDKVDVFHFSYAQEQKAIFESVILGSATAIESSKRIKNILSSTDIQLQLEKASSFLSVKSIEKIESFTNSDDYKYLVIVIDIDSRGINIFKDSEVSSLLDIEKENIGTNKKTALIMSNAVNGIIEAYPNFVINIDMFLSYLSYIKSIDFYFDDSVINRVEVFEENFWDLVFKDMDFNLFPRNKIFENINGVLTTSIHDVTWHEYLTNAGIFQKESSDKVTYLEIVYLYVDNFELYISSEELDGYVNYIDRIEKLFNKLKSSTSEYRYSVIVNFMENN